MSHSEKCRIDIVGNRYGRLVVVSYSHADPKNFKAMWLCKCDCGNSKIIMGGSLKQGHTKSCGCFLKEKISQVNTIHGDSQPGSNHYAEYKCWKGIKARCYSKKTRSYISYGGRGIAVCDRWKDSFENFYADVGNRPSSSHSLDRFPNNNGDYEPGNVRWATASQQARNKRTNLKVEFHGQKRLICELADEFNIPLSALYSRVRRLGWTVEDAVNKPFKKTCT
jgi:hypothetical protein